MCLRRITLKNESRKYSNDNTFNTVPCGRCVKCINKLRSEWAFRMYQESKDHSFSYFATLTYSEENLPYLNLTTGEYPVRLIQSAETLSEQDHVEKIVYKKDVQDFIKNVRRQQHYYTSGSTYENLKIRYYAASEYGTKFTKRPHYHVILWSLHPYIAKKIELQKIWKKGGAKIEPLDQGVKTYYYVTKYLYKQKNYDIWTFKPFTLMSTVPFIGNRYLETSTDYHISKGDLITTFNGREMLIPRIYRERLPIWLRKKTQKRLEEYSEKRRKDLHKQTHRENYHPSILKMFQNAKMEQQYQKEFNDFKQLF